jgi:hypothetical protein
MIRRRRGAPAPRPHCGPFTFRQRRAPRPDPRLAPDTSALRTARRAWSGVPPSNPDPRCRKPAPWRGWRWRRAYAGRAAPGGDRAPPAPPAPCGPQDGAGRASRHPATSPAGRPEGRPGAPFRRAPGASAGASRRESRRDRPAPVPPSAWSIRATTTGATIAHLHTAGTVPRTWPRRRLGHLDNLGERRDRPAHRETPTLGPDHLPPLGTERAPRPRPGSPASRRQMHPRGTPTISGGGIIAARRTPGPDPQHGAQCTL